MFRVRVGMYPGARARTFRYDGCSDSLMNLHSPIRTMLGGLALSGLLALASPAAQADGLQSLRAFVQNAHSGRAEFTQTVTSPAREGQPPRVKTSSGRFEFQRPGRFRFDYLKPFAQTIVADGHTLWLHDPDLNQVTQRAQDQALGQTPAALIAAASDLSALEAQFRLEAEPDSDGLQWIRATPRSADGQLQWVRVGFDGERLARLEIQDGFGQHSVLKFSQVEVNPTLPADSFEFRVPPGTDVLRQ